MPKYLGLDCGGSTSRALILDEEETQIFAETAGPANLLTTGTNKLRASLRAVTTGAPQPDVVCGCFAGLIDDQTHARAIGFLRELFPHAQLRAEPDYAAAYRAFEEPIDICIIAGTGSLICSSDNGGMVRSGGRGYILGDSGSGYRYGRDALNAYLDAPEQASTALRTAVERVFRTLSANEIVSMVYTTGSPAAMLSKLSKCVAQDAQNDEAYALASLQRNSQDLAKVLKQHVERWFPSRRMLRMGLAGGLWKSSAMFRNAAVEAFNQVMPDHNFEISLIKRPPVYGAVALAMELKHGH